MQTGPVCRGLQTVSVWVWQHGTPLSGGETTCCRLELPEPHLLPGLFIPLPRSCWGNGPTQGPLCNKPQVNLTALLGMVPGPDPGQTMVIDSNSDNNSSYCVSATFCTVPFNPSLPSHEVTTLTHSSHHSSPQGPERAAFIPLLAPTTNSLADTARSSCTDFLAVPQKSRQAHACLRTFAPAIPAIQFFLR